jgi:hypothetical protein
MLRQANYYQVGLNICVQFRYLILMLCDRNFYVIYILPLADKLQMGLRDFQVYNLFCFDNSATKLLILGL